MLTFMKVFAEIVERDDALNRHQPKCPACGTDQVQIMSKDIPARWRCRMCKHPFVSEPIRDSV